MAEWYEIDNPVNVPTPALLIYPDRIEENLRRMITLAGGVARLRPHVKTHKIEEIVRMKLAAGITKFKTSTIAEAELTARAGGLDILVAYPLVGPNIDRLLQLMEAFPSTKFSSLVDDQTVLDEIAAKAKQSSKTVELYVDLNVGMGRTGIVPGVAAMELYRSLSRLEGVGAAGLHAYDGHIHEADFDALKKRVEQTFEPVWKMRAALREEGLAVPNVIAAGTPTSKLLALHDDVEVGAGTTVLWDAGQLRLSPDLEFLNAAVLMVRVVSRPEPDRLCLDLGHKAVASEMPHPRVRIFGLEDATAVVHSEEHLVLETPRASEYPVGHVFYGVPYHVCPTVALHDEALCVRDGRVTDAWKVAARGRKLTF